MCVWFADRAAGRRLRRERRDSRQHGLALVDVINKGNIKLD